MSDELLMYLEYRRGILIGLAIGLMLWATWQMLNGSSYATAYYYPVRNFRSRKETPNVMGEGQEQRKPDDEIEPET